MGNLDMIEDKNIAPVSMDFEPLPKGLYKVEITESEVKETSKGGLMLKVEFTVIDGVFKSRKVWTNFNIVNANEKAQIIGRGQLSALAQACGHMGIPEDSTNLHHLPLNIRVDIRTSPGYDAQNEVKGYYPLDKAAPKVGNVEVAPADDDKLPF